MYICSKKGYEYLGRGNKMIYKNYGSTEIKVSKIGMGCMRFPEEYIRQRKIENCIELVRYAYSKGINLYDVAPFYCHDLSELIVGEALSVFPRESYYLNSKTNLSTLKHDFSYDGFMKRLKESLSRLKTDYLDFYCLWCMLDANSCKENIERLYPYFLKAKEEGYIRHIIMSSHMSSEELEQFLFSDYFVGVIVGHNPINYKYRINAIKKAFQNNIATVIMNPLSGGLIPRNQKYFKNIFCQDNLNVCQSVIRFEVAHREITSVLIGFSNIKEIDEAICAIEGVEEEDSDILYEKFLKSGNFRNDLCTGCNYCNKCHKGIDIPKYMDAYNQLILGEPIHERLRKHWKIFNININICIKCGNCEKLCTQHLPIMDRLEYINKLLSVK